jgi:hypothetical protein
MIGVNWLLSFLLPGLLKLKSNQLLPVEGFRQLFCDYKELKLLCITGPLNCFKLVLVYLLFHLPLLYNLHRLH